MLFLIHGVNRKKRFISNNITVIKSRLQKFSNSIYLWNFFEIHNLYIMWLYDLRFITCKISVDAFSLLYSKLLLAKFVFVLFLLHRIGNLLAYVAALLVASFWGF